MNVQSTIAARKNTHGPFENNARASQELKAWFRQQPSWTFFTDIQKESVELICTKFSRIMTGDPHYDDHWHDVAGYATLAEVSIPKDVLGKMALAAVEKAVKVD